MTVLAILAVIFLLAFLTESLVEYLFGALVDHVPALTSYKWLLMYIAAGVGVSGRSSISLTCFTSWVILLKRRFLCIGSACC